MIKFKNKTELPKHFTTILKLLPVSAPTWAKFGHGEHAYYRRIHMWAQVEVVSCTERDYYNDTYEAKAASIEIIGCIAPTQAEGRCHSLKPIDVFTMGMPEYVTELPN